KLYNKTSRGQLVGEACAVAPLDEASLHQIEVEDGPSALATMEGAAGEAKTAVNTHEVVPGSSSGDMITARACGDTKAVASSSSPGRSNRKALGTGASNLERQLRQNRQRAYNHSNILLSGNAARPMALSPEDAEMGSPPLDEDQHVVGKSGRAVASSPASIRAAGWGTYPPGSSGDERTTSHVTSYEPASSRHSSQGQLLGSDPSISPNGLVGANRAGQHRNLSGVSGVGGSDEPVDSNAGVCGTTANKASMDGIPGTSEAVTNGAAVVGSESVTREAERQAHSSHAVHTSVKKGASASANAVHSVDGKMQAETPALTTNMIKRMNEQQPQKHDALSSRVGQLQTEKLKRKFQPPTALMEKTEEDEGEAKGIAESDEDYTGQSREFRSVLQSRTSGHSPSRPSKPTKPINNPSNNYVKSHQSGSLEFRLVPVQCAQSSSTPVHRGESSEVHLEVGGTLGRASSAHVDQLSELSGGGAQYPIYATHQGTGGARPYHSEPVRSVGQPWPAWDSMTPPLSTDNISSMRAISSEGRSFVTGVEVPSSVAQTGRNISESKLSGQTRGDSSNAQLQPETGETSGRARTADTQLASPPGEGPSSEECIPREISSGVTSSGRRSPHESSSNGGNNAGSSNYGNVSSHYGSSSRSYELSSNEAP
ncbi:unnamed protein product, partial [Amoebophrya sp. A25]